MINAMFDSKHPLVPVAGDQENGVLMGLAPNPSPSRISKAGANYFPKLSPNFTCTVSFPDADINLTPEEVMNQTAENQ